MTGEFYTFDRHYLERLQRADLPTEQHFADYFGRLIRLKLESRMDCRSAIDDIRQETFLRIWAALRKDEGIRQPERFGAFVISVCNNVVREHRRTGRRENCSDDDLADRLPDTAMGATDVAIAQDVRQQVGRVLAELPAKHRDLIQKVFLDECDKDQLCRDLGVDRKYLRVLLHRAGRQFRQHYLREERARARRGAKRPHRVSCQDVDSTHSKRSRGDSRLRVSRVPSTFSRNLIVSAGKLIRTSAASTKIGL